MEIPWVIFLLVIFVCLVIGAAIGWFLATGIDP
jgi:uncharacterized protein YneF (UPF0154 family)